MNGAEKNRKIKDLAKESAILAEIGRIISSTLKINEVYERFAREVKKLIPFDRIAINLLDAERNIITTPYESGLVVPGRRIGQFFPLKDSFNDAVMQTRSGVIYYPRTEKELERRFPYLKPVFRAGIRSYMGAPLFYRDQVIGTLQFRSKKRSVYQKRHLKIAERIAGQIAGAIANAQLFLKLEKTERAQRASERQLRLLSSHLLSAQESERRRISRELHDEMGQSLTLLKFQMGYVEKHLPLRMTALRQECAEAQKNIETIIENVRRLSRDLRPSILEDLGLEAALRRLGQDFSKLYRLQASLNVKDVSLLTSSQKQVMVYRILQEALTNIGKHARATQVSLHVERKGDCLRFLVEDNGKGFSPRKTGQKNQSAEGLGLATIAERTRLLGGRMNIQSKEGKGTRLTLIVPIGKKR
jgi:signal transduction histidine kinase